MQDLHQQKPPDAIYSNLHLKAADADCLSPVDASELLLSPQLSFFAALNASLRCAAIL